jgi:hypothetical protein
MEINVEHLGAVQLEIKMRAYSIISDQPLLRTPKIILRVESPAHATT